MNPFVRRNLPLISTAAIFILLFASASLKYDGFFSGSVLVNIFSDNAVLGITAVGMTLVIFAGGIDLSVGAVVAYTSIFSAILIQRGEHPGAVAFYVLSLGALFGAFMGTLIHVFKQPAFLITLAGMFLARGMGFWVSNESTSITHPLYDSLSRFELSIGENVHVPLTALLLLATIVVGYVVAHFTRFGRNLLAIGGSEQSALLMGLPVGATKIAAYTLNSTLAAFAGLVATLYTGSGNPSLGVGLELDSIAIVVIGGTLLAGGRGHMIGTLFGILVFGTIQSAILFDGRLDSAWVRIVVAALLLTFILLQRAIVRSTAKR
ncbi:sugar ABC transporter permease YjfF [Nibricoccus aquaticus]|uniref:Sugar ABC transporter permease YjfF n=1 Tax=Nibricoccus aquaticus TaxID=2576891 RepID=A0A290QG31_9BACT|nr:galactofuranose ABC transporter, permease protein YjfF [Nibricoccus aquaticus]ATC62842.1 sugar ABC transporter permease YjfF [Nibricoccus aquaticus]